MRTLRTLSFLGLAAASAVASADFIDFESDTSGYTSNGFVSAGSPNVAFSDTLGADLAVFGTQETIGKGLFVFDDDISALRMDFSQSYTNLSLVFGNDDPRFTNPGDLAILDLYFGSTLISSVSVTLNRDDLPNQTVSYSGAAFNGAIFRYADSSGRDINLIEVVDNISFSSTSAVPGPMAALPFALMALRRRKRA